ncbi:MarR family winged helix-turn-helix transcriptional regulator [Photobacterium sp. OFAV2-7]|uniref:MarR family winged helix-turn-helix transcriptional regulator n=1 Tax=Photobacterium sp. OFAV2-7 TaxID=2917748 RepID=UPI001EF554EE|nr:MarR family transcriptional regulator [Photobacterium sp. OFAV2-7]MCG7588348.1 MarR family transcriptional regulator [Photobacterium sp. OFAV2-7]
MANNTDDLETKEAIALENQVCFPLYSAANAVVRAYRPLLNALDLTYPQYLVMMVLWEHNGINVKELGAKLYLDSGTLTPLLKRLETKGLVVRTRGLEDERVRMISLSDEGVALKKKALGIPGEMACKVGGDIEELAQLKYLCEKLVKTLNR